MRTAQLRGLSPATVKLVNELYSRQFDQKRRFLARWRTDERTSAMIDQIRGANEPAAIRELMPFGLSHDASVSAAARAAIHHFFAMVPVEALPVLDDRLRQTWEYLDDWFGLRPHSLESLQLRSDSDRVFLGLVASHRSGYVRAEAIRMMGTDPSEILLPFVFLRLADWVDEVRTAAEKELNARLQTKFAKTFVDSLELLDRLATSTRFRPEYSKWVDQLMASPECATELQRGMTLPSRGIRRHCFRLAACNPKFLLRDVVSHAVDDTDVLIRKWAFTAGPELLPDDRSALRMQAAKDSYGPIRRLAFEALVTGEGVPLEDFVRFLRDRSTAIRRECQSVVRRRFEISPADFYRQELQASGTKAVDISVLGLAETGEPQDQAAIVNLLGSPSARIRRAAIRALRILEADLNADALLLALSADIPSVAREAALTLLVGRKTPVEWVWAAASRNPDHRVRAGVLKLLRNAGKWPQVQLYLEAVVDPEPSVSVRAIGMLSQWIQRSNTSFTQLTADEKLVISRLIDAARNRLPAELGRLLDFIIKTSQQ